MTKAMKRFLLIAILTMIAGITNIACADVPIDATCFPDDHFRQYIIDAGFDANGDYTLDETECSNVIDIIVPEMGIKSLKGIEYFPNLGSIVAWHNNIAKVDFSENTLLQHVYLNYNRIKTIDVSNLSNLMTLEIEENPISAVDITHNPNLCTINVSYTNVSKLDVSENAALRNLNCQASKVRELDISCNPMLNQLICQVTHIQSLDLSNNTELTSLWMSATDISSIDLSHNTALTELFIGENPMPCLDLSNNHLLTDLRATGICIFLPVGTEELDMCTYKGFVPAKASNWTGAEYNAKTGVMSNRTKDHVNYDYDCGNGLSISVTLCFTGDVKVNQANFPDPVFRKYIKDQYGSVISTEEINQLEDIDVDGLGVSSLTGIELFPNLVNLRCPNNPIKELKLTSHNLLNLFIDNTQITKLDIGKQPTLSWLQLDGCQFSAIDLSLFPALTVLSVCKTNIRSLNVQCCKELEVIYLTDSPIAELDLHGLSAFTQIYGISSIHSVPAYIEDDQLIVDISGFVTRLDHVTFEDCISYDKKTGIAVFDKNIGKIVTYQYKTGNPSNALTVSCYLEFVSQTDLSRAKIAKIKDQVYTGKAIKPSITVKLDGKKLAKDTDYTVTWKNNKAVGTATVIVKGIGSYTGTVKTTFKINPKPVTLSSLKAGKNKLTVKWKKGSGITGYELQYSLKKNFSSKKTTNITKAKATSKEIKSLKKGKTYYVRIRAYKTVNGTKYYSAWSKVLKAKVK